jgi:hypothetical protein
MSIACWWVELADVLIWKPRLRAIRIIVYSPQIIENYRLKSGEGALSCYLYVWLCAHVKLLERIVCPVHYYLAFRRPLESWWSHHGRITPNCHHSGNICEDSALISFLITSLDILTQSPVDSTAFATSFSYSKSTIIDGAGHPPMPMTIPLTLKRHLFSLRKKSRYLRAPGLRSCFMELAYCLYSRPAPWLMLFAGLQTAMDSEVALRGKKILLNGVVRHLDG